MLPPGSMFFRLREEAESPGIPGKHPVAVDPSIRQGVPRQKMKARGPKHRRR